MNERVLGVVRALRAVKAGFFDALFPRTCVGCGGEGNVWCENCAAQFAPSRLTAECPFCAAPGSNQTCLICRATRSLDGLTACFTYADPSIRKLITGWKYHGDMEYAGAIGRLLRARLSKSDLPLSKGELEGIVFDAITAVPLHASRLRSRGFNQASVVAITASSVLGIPNVDLLVRTRNTKAQANIAHERRQASDLVRAFAANPLLSKEGLGVVKGGRILLCDDVFTTGATMDAAAAALKAAGAEFVWGLTVAKG